MDPSQVDIPPLKDLTIDNITDNVHLINSRCPNPRLKYVLERLIVHAHDFARETRLSTDEWMAGIQFLTEVGQICSDVRQVRAVSRCRRPAAGADSRPGIHPPLRHHRPVAPRRQHRPPQAARQHRGHRARPLPHPRRPHRAQRLRHLARPRRRALPRPLHRQGHGREPHRGRQDRRLGDRLQGLLRRAVQHPPGARRPGRAVERQAGRVLVQGNRARALPHPARRARGEAVEAAEEAPLPPEPHALHVREGGLRPSDHSIVSPQRSVRDVGRGLWRQGDPACGPGQGQCRAGCQVRRQGGRQVDDLRLRPGLGRRGHEAARGKRHGCNEGARPENEALERSAGSGCGLMSVREWHGV